MTSEGGSGQRRNEWDRALIGGDNALLARLIEGEPAVVYEQFQKFITTNYKMISSNPDELAKNLPEELKAELHASIRNRLNEKLPYYYKFRRRLGSAIQELDIAHLRELRRHNSLTLVLGAGVTIDAGGPSWAGLVIELLSLLQTSGTEVMTEKLVPRTPGVRGRSWSDYRLVESRKALGPYPEHVRAKALQMLKRMGNNSDPVSDEILKDGAQLCIDVLGNDLFVHVASSIYRKVPTPGRIHRAIAALSEPQIVTLNDGVTKQRTMGWDFIFTYNFDDMIGEALGAKSLPFARMVSKQGGVHGDPSSPALDEKQDLHLKVVHLHGYTPRRLFNLEGIDFVFSMSQFKEHTMRGRRNLIIQTFKDQFLDEPGRTMLYVGCSFMDEAMNALLEEAHEQYPGREYFAILCLPASLASKDRISPEELEEVSAEHRHRGVQPIWVRKFEAIPELLQRLK